MRTWQIDTKAANARAARPPNVRLYKKCKGEEAKLCFMGHEMMENRRSKLVDACLMHADRATACK